MRTLKLAGAAVAVLGALTACGANMQGAALFVEDERISEATVDGYVDDFADLSIEQGAVLADIDYGANREQIVLWLLVSELGERLDLPEPDTSGATSDLHAIYIEASEYLTAIYSEVQPRELTDAEIAQLRELGIDYDQIGPERQAGLMASASLYDTLTGYIDEFDIRVNPRYGLESIPVASEEFAGMFEVEIPQR